MLLRSLSLSVIFVVAASLPAWGQSSSTVQASLEESKILSIVQSLTKIGVLVARELITESRDAMKDHFEFKKTIGPGLTPKELFGQFELKMFPKGKKRSDEHVKAESSFRLSRAPGDENFEISLGFGHGRAKSVDPQGLEDSDSEE